MSLFVYSLVQDGEKLRGGILRFSSSLGFCSSRKRGECLRCEERDKEGYLTRDYAY